MAARQDSTPSGNHRRVETPECGRLGKQDNCRVAVSVSLATEEAGIPAMYRLYLPER